MGKEWVFDTRQGAREYTLVRQQVLAQLLPVLRSKMELCSAVDVGCGVGHFSKFLSDLDFRVVALDGRGENVAEGRRRFPDITFLVRNVEDPTLPEIGTFDFVLCVGLLYHLENPFRAIRNLHALTRRVLLVEGMCVPDRQPVMYLLDEGIAEDQGVNYVAFYPSERCLTRMLYRSGFQYVYRLEHLPIHKFFRTTPLRKRERTMLVASKVELALPNLMLIEDHVKVMIGGIADPWATQLSKLRWFAHVAHTVGMRITRFVRRPWDQKREVVSWYMKRTRRN